MCPCTKFKSDWRPLDLGNKSAKNYMNDKLLKNKH